MDRIESEIQQLERLSRLRRLKTKTKLNPETGCLEWTGALFQPSGYGMFHWGYEESGYRRVLPASRAAWVLVNGEPGEQFVLHTCHNRLCCNVDHLYLGDHDQNMKDRDEAGRTKKGQDHYYFKRTPELIEALKADVLAGFQIADICKRNKISWGTFFTTRDGNPELAALVKQTKSARYANGQLSSWQKRRAK